MTSSQHRSSPPSRGMTRRQLLMRAGALGAAGFSLPAFLAACGGDDGGGDGGAQRLLFENWTEYIDPTEDDLVGTVDRFIAASGIQLTYSEAYNSNNEYFAKIQPVLGRGEVIEPDIIAPTGWMAGRLINLGWCEKLPLDQIPNAANLEDSFKNPAWDPTGEYSLPWQAGFAGIAYNIDVTGREIRTIEEMFSPEFAGRLGMNSEMRDTIGLIAMSLGIDIGSLSTFEDAAPAFEFLERAKADGLIRRFHGNDYGDDLTNGNFAATFGWSGDIAQYALENDAVRFVFPESGATSWADTMVIPKGARNQSAAAQWMNFVYDPVEAAQIAAWVQYVSPVKGVREELTKIDPELAENPLLFPDEATLARTQSFAYLSDEVEAQYDQAFSRITGA